MTTIRAYTTIEQSRKLAEILPLESADACWTNHLFDSILSSWRIESTPPQEYKALLNRFVVRGYLIESCWSLAALLGVLPLVDFTTPQLIGTPKTLYRCIYNDDLKSHAYDNPVDACVDMIERLHELNLL